MSRIAYVNGRYLPHSEAGVSIEDRGYQFADGIYEVIEVWQGALVDEDLHLIRLRRSSSELMLSDALSESALRLVLREVVRRNRVRDGMIYIQITRGVAGRDHYFPDPPVRPILVVTARSIDAGKVQAKADKGIRVISMPDIRWKRPDIKSISLLPNVLAKEMAKRRGAAEAWLFDADGRITEGAASNAWIVDRQNTVITHQADQTILRGVTRTTLMRLIAARDLRYDERSFTLDEVYEAKEAFITGATTLVMPVVAVDDRLIGDGQPGPIVRALRRDFHAAAQKSSA